MTLERPIFLKWIIQEPDNWHLKENAPDWAKKEFERFMRELNERPIHRQLQRSH